MKHLVKITLSQTDSSPPPSEHFELLQSTFGKLGNFHTPMTLNNRSSIEVTMCTAWSPHDIRELFSNLGEGFNFAVLVQQERNGFCDDCDNTSLVAAE